MSLISVPHPDGIDAWLVTCKLNLSPKCSRTYYTANEAEDVGCAACTAKEHEIRAEAEARRLDREALTPDDHPETGLYTVMTEEEIWGAGFISGDNKKKVGGKWV